MKTVKTKRFLLVISLVLVLSLAVGLTMAYFSARAEAKGGKTVALGGETTIIETQNYDNKVIQIKNTGDTDVIVRVTAYGPNKITASGSGWIEDKDGYWYYDSVLESGATSTPLTATWDVPKDLGDDYQVVVVHESEQAVYGKDGKIVKPTTNPAWAIVPAAN